MAALEKAIAELSTKYGGASSGVGDSMELPHIGGPNAPGVGMPGGTIGTNSMGIAHGPGAPGGTVGTHGGPKSGLAGGTIGTEKSLGGNNPLHRHHRHHRHLPGVSVAKSASPGATVGTKTPVYSVAKSASPGATIGTKTPVLQTAQVAAAPTPANTTDADMQKFLDGIKGGGGEVLGQGTSSIALSNMGGGGAAGGVIGT